MLRSLLLLCGLLLLQPRCSQAATRINVINDRRREICRILALWPISEASPEGYSHMTAAELARQHFNERNARVVPELEAFKTCSVELGEFWFRDTTDDSTLKSLEAFQQVQDEVCAVVGPDTVRAIEVLSGSARQKGVPMVTTLVPPSPRTQLPMVLSTRHSLQQKGRAVAEYLQSDQFGDEPRKYIEILFTDEAFEVPLQVRGEEEPDLDFSSSRLLQADGVTINEAAFEEVTKKGERTFILDTSRPDLLPQIADYAAQYNMLGPETLWIISEQALPPGIVGPSLGQVFQATKGSNLDRLLTGAAIYADYDPFLVPHSDKYVQIWSAQNQTALTEYMESTPSRYFSFVYDAVMLLGMGACRQDNTTHLDQMLHTRFHGASGWFQLEDDNQGERMTPSNVTSFAFYNLQPRTANVGGMHTYEAVLTSLYSNNQWQKTSNAFVYKDGSTTAPMPQRTTSDYHYLQPGVVTVGLFLMSLALAISVGSGLWVFFHRKETKVAVGQTEFLYLLCLGAALVACSIVFVSFDEQQGFSPNQLGKMCQAFPWFMFGGYIIMYCALAGKLWRLGKLTENPLRRQKIQVYQGLWPFVFLVACVIVLICWQLLHPLDWERVEVAEGPLETAGTCSGERVVPYVVTIGLLLICVTALTLFNSWKVHHLQEELSDSKWVFAGVFSHLQLLLVGVPLFIIMNNDSTDASYLIKVALAFLFSTVMVALIIWPKALSVHVASKTDEAKGFKLNISGRNSEACRVSGMGYSANTRYNDANGLSGMDRDGNTSRYDMSESNGASGLLDETRNGRGYQIQIEPEYFEQEGWGADQKCKAQSYDRAEWNQDSGNTEGGSLDTFRNVHNAEPGNAEGDSLDQTRYGDRHQIQIEPEPEYFEQEGWGTDQHGKVQSYDGAEWNRASGNAEGGSLDTSRNAHNAEPGNAEGDSLDQTRYGGGHQIQIEPEPEYFDQEGCGTIQSGNTRCYNRTTRNRDSGNKEGGSLDDSRHGHNANPGNGSLHGTRYGFRRQIQIIEP